MRWRFLAVFGLLLLLAMEAVSCAAIAPAPKFGGGDLKAPFEIERQRAIFGAAIEGFSCPPPLDPVRNLQIADFYGNSDKYGVDTKELRLYQAKITSMGDDFVRSKPANAAIAECVLQWLYAWAQADSLLGSKTQQGRYEQQWSVVTIASAYLKVRDSQGLDASKKARVEAWIAKLAQAMFPHYALNPQREDASNNHRYWAGLGAVLAGIATNNKEMFNWGLDAFAVGVNQIGVSGNLPLEDKRGRKALHYHNFALEPLILMAEAAAANGMDLYSLREGAIHKLVKRVLDGLDGKGDLGRGQDAVPERDFTWMEPYYKRFKDPRLVPYLKKYRPLRNIWFADATLLFGEVEL